MKIEQAKHEIGEFIYDIADGHGAITKEDSKSAAKCKTDFINAAGESIYELIKLMVKDYASAWSIPEYSVHDKEEDFASDIPKFIAQIQGNCYIE